MTDESAVWSIRRFNFGALKKKLSFIKWLQKDTNSDASQQREKSIYLRKYDIKYVHLGYGLVPIPLTFLGRFVSCVMLCCQ